jgi:hypothetical protein
MACRPRNHRSSAMLMSLLMTVPVLAFALFIAPQLHFAPWSRWIIVAAWIGFGVLAGQHTLQKMGGDAGPIWWSNFARAKMRDAPKRRR